MGSSVLARREVLGLVAVASASFFTFKSPLDALANAGDHLDDIEAVKKTTDLWLHTVTSGKRTAAADTAALYAPEAMLWGTVSSEVRDTPAEIRDYFNFFAAEPELRVSDYRPYIRVFDKDFAINAGYYTFTWKDVKTHADVEKHARYSFAYKKDPTAPTGWVIVDHHSSVVPASPKELKHAN